MRQKHVNPTILTRVLYRKRLENFRSTIDSMLLDTTKLPKKYSTFIQTLNNHKIKKS